jgi:hypothetical protein
MSINIVEKTDKNVNTDKSNISGFAKRIEEALKRFPADDSGMVAGYLYAYKSSVAGTKDSAKNPIANFLNNVDPYLKYDELDLKTVDGVVKISTKHHDALISLPTSVKYFLQDWGYGSFKSLRNDV